MAQRLEQQQTLERPSGPSGPSGGVSFSGLQEPCAAGSIVEVVINAQGSADGLVVVEAVSPTNRVYRCPVQQRGSTFTATFTPTEVGEWRIGIFYDGQHIKGSPFAAYVYDANLVQVFGLDVGVVGQELKFNVSTEAAGLGDLKVNVVHQNRSIPARVERQGPGDGLYRIQFTPDGAGQYKIHIYFNAMEVKGSPFILDIVDASSVSVYGDNLRMACVGRLSTFMIHAVGADVKDLTVTIMAPSGKRKRARVVAGKDNTYHVEWKPIEAGEHYIDVRLYNQSVRGSPFTCNVGDPDLITVRNMPHQIRENEMGERKTFEIDASAAGSGNLEILINGGRVPCKVRELGGRCYLASFVPQTFMTHIIDMRFNGEPVKDSPWRCEVQKAGERPAMGNFILQPIQLSSYGAPPGYLGSPTSTMSKTQSEFRETNVTQSQQHAPPPAGKKHFDEVTRDYKTMSFTVDIFGRGLQDACVGKVANFEIGGRGLRSDDIEVRVTGPSGKAVPCKTIAARTGNFRCEYVPTEVGTYRIDLAIQGQRIDGSPFAVATFAPHKVFIEPIPGGAVGKPVQFVVDANDAGKGELEISVNQGRVPNNVQMQGTGRCLVTFIPEIPGTYIIDITFNGELVRGCPIRVEVHGDGSSLERAPLRPLRALSPDRLSPARETGWRPSPHSPSMHSPRSAGKPDRVTYVSRYDQQSEDQNRIREDTAKIKQPYLASYTAPGGRGDRFSPVPITRREGFSPPPIGGRHAARSPPLARPERYSPELDDRERDRRARFSPTTEMRVYKHDDTPEPPRGTHRMPDTYDTPRRYDHREPERSISPVGTRGTHVEVRRGKIMPEDSWIREPEREREQMPPPSKMRREAEYTPSASSPEEDLPDSAISERYERYEKFEKGVHSHHYRGQESTPHPLPQEKWVQRTVEAERKHEPPPPAPPLPRDDDYIDTVQVGKEPPHQRGHVPAVATTEEAYYTSAAPNIVKEEEYHAKHAPPPLGQEELLIREREHERASPEVVKELSEVTTRDHKIDRDRVVHHEEARHAPHDYTSHVTETEVGHEPALVEDEGVVEEEQLSDRSDDLPADLSVVKLDGPGLGVVRVNHSTYFDILALKGSRQKLKVTIISPTRQHLLSSVQKTVKGYRVEYTPQEVGSHQIHIDVDKDQLPGTPHVIKVYDPEMILVGDMKLGVMGSPVEFTVDATRAGYGNLEIAIKDIDGQILPSRVTQIDQKSRFTVSFTPVRVVPYQIHIAFNGVPLSNSPFLCPVEKPVEEMDLVTRHHNVEDRDTTFAKIPQESRPPKLLQVGKEVSFPVIGSGNGPLKATVKAGPSGQLTPASVKDTGADTYRVEFMPEGVGDHTIEVKFGDVHVNGSPFTCRVYDSRKIKVGDIPSGRVGEPIHFVVDASEAGVGNLEVAVNEGKIPSMAHGLGQHRYDISFVPREDQDHTIGIRFNGEDVPGSPFVCRIAPPLKAVARGPGVEKVHAGRPTEFEVELVGLKSQTGQFDVKIKDPANVEVPVRIQGHPETGYRVEYTPENVGTHTIDLRYDGQSISVPLNAKVYDSSKVKLSDVEGKIAGKTSHFFIDAAKAGAGNMEIIVSVAGRNVPNFVQAEGNAKFKVSFTPQEPKTHTISVRFNDEAVPGSPTTCDIIDANFKCAASGEGLNQVIAHKTAHFTVDAKEQPGKECNVVITAPGGQELPAWIREDLNERGLFRVEYTPNDAGNYNIAITYGGQKIDRSPFTVNCFDPDKVEVLAPNPPVLNKPVTFEISTERAGEGHLTVDIVCQQTNLPVRCDVAKTMSNYHYHARFVPNVRCPHTVNVQYNGHPVKNSPYICEVFDAQDCSASGDGLKLAQVHQSADFEIMLSQPGLADELEIVVLDPRKKRVACSLQKNEGGRFRGEFIPREVGPHSVDILFSGTPIRGSPFWCEAFDLQQVQVMGTREGFVGKEHRLTVDHAAAGKGFLDVEVFYKDRKLRNMLHSLDDGITGVSFMPQEAGAHRVDILFNGAMVPGAPFELSIADASQLQAEGEGLYHAVVAVKSYFVIHMEGSGRGELDVTVTAPDGSAVPVKCYQQKDGNYRVEYSPNLTGKHKIEVTFADTPIFGSPFIAEVFDPTKVQLGDVKLAGLNQTAKVLLDRRLAGQAELQVQVLDPKKRVLTHEIHPSPTGEEEIRFVPTSSGKHMIRVSYGNIDVPHTPVHFDVDENAPTAHGDGLECGAVRQPVSFLVEARRLKGDIKLEINGPYTALKPEVVKKEQGVFAVTYTPAEPGEHIVNIQWNSKAIAGSPFTPQIVDPSRVKILPEQLHAMQDGKGRIQMRVGQEKILPIDASEAGKGVLRAEIRGPSNTKLVGKVVDDKAHHYKLHVTPELEGEHFIYLYYADYPVPDTPLSAVATPALREGDTDVGQVQVKGDGIKEARTNMLAEFYIDGSDAGHGKPSCTMLGQRADIPISLTHQGNNVWKASYTPIIPGKYELHVFWGERELKDSPYKVPVNLYADASKVIVNTEQVKQGILGRELKSTIDTRKAGPGKLFAECLGPNKATECELFDHLDGTYSLNIKPVETGKHTLTIKYGEDHVPGSPYTLYISSPPDASRVQVSGPGVEHGILARFKSNFVVDTKGAGAGQLTVRVRGPKGAFNVEMQREHRHDRSIHCRYDPREPGDYQIEVRWAGDHVPGSPFQVMIFDTQSELERFMSGQPVMPGPAFPFLPPGFVGGPPPGLIMPPPPRGPPPMFPPRGYPYASSTLHSNASAKWVAQGDY